jgi:glycerol kinase
MSGDGEKYVAALDVGTTKLKCIIFDQNLNVRGEEATPVRICLSPFTHFSSNQQSKLLKNILIVVNGNSLFYNGIIPYSNIFTCMHFYRNGVDWDKNRYYCI